MTRAIFWLLGLAALFFGSYIGFFHIHNGDVWWHIAWGQQMLAQHTFFPSADFFYFTPTSTDYLRELPNTFLGDIGLALLFRLGGALGLQLLVLVCLFGGALAICLPWKKELYKNPSRIAVVMFLFFAFCLGTSQLQAVRNAIISLALFPLTLALYWNHTRQGGWKPLLYYIPLFFLWSWIHPSYLLGIIALLLLYGGDYLTWLFYQKTEPRPSTPFLITFGVLLLILFSTLSYSWQPRQLLSTGITHTTSALVHFLKTEKNKASVSTNTLTTITQPLWAKGAAPLSGDFTPTWTAWYHPAAWGSLLLALLAWLALLFGRTPHKLGIMSLLALTTYFGCCYLRGTGYLTISAVFTLSAVLPTLRLWQSRVATFLNRGAALCVLIALIGMANIIVSQRSEFFFKEKGRIFGSGTAAVFDGNVYQFAKEHFPTAPCFTTMVTGSYASCLWQGGKKVFIDSFFAPHSKTLWKDYEKLTATQDESVLDAYNIQIALVENSRLEWQSFFLNAPEWRPIALGKGVTLYGKENLISAEAPMEILFDHSDIASLASTERRALAAAYYNAILVLQLHQLSQAAATTIKNNETLFSILATNLDPIEQGNIRLDPPGIKPALLTP